MNCQKPSETTKMLNKVCSGCKKTQPLDAFYKRRQSPDGLMGTCKVCRAAYMAARRTQPHIREKERECGERAYAKADKQKRAEVAKALRAANPERYRAYTNAYAARNREKMRERDRVRYASNVDKEKVRRATAHKLNPKAGEVRKKVWRKENAAKVRAYSRAWCQLNKEKYALRKQQRRELLKVASDFDIFTLKEAAQLCELRQTKTGFKWQIDHIVPLSKGGTHAHSNVQVVPAAWNAAKRDRHTARFFPVGLRGAPTEEVTSPICVK